MYREVKSAAANFAVQTRTVVCHPSFHYVRKIMQVLSPAITRHNSHIQKYYSREYIDI